MKIELATAGIETSGMRAIIGENKITLESSLAVLPLSLKVDMEVTSDFTLFLSPVKMESGIKNNIGALCYKELKTTIKNITKSNRPKSFLSTRITPINDTFSNSFGHAHNVFWPDSFVS